MLHKVIITITALLIAGSAIAELLIPSEMLTFVGIDSTQQTDFLLRTTAVVLLALLPGLWSVRNEATSSTARNVLIGTAAYMFLSSTVDAQAFAQGIVNTMSVPSIALRVLWGIAILGLIFRNR
jgi:hypothetical protein